MNNLIAKVIDSFNSKFNSEPEIVASAPGRVNIIGEHTDYTGGYVLPVAIDKEVIFAAKKNKTDIINGYSVDFKDKATTDIKHYDRNHPSKWFRYIMGVLDELEKGGFSIEGFDFTVGGNVPVGAGLSSSAAIETAVLKAMEALFTFEVPDKSAAVICQNAENNFVGMNCGIMDQFISRMGVKDHAIFINCTDLTSHTVKINTDNYSWIIIDSKKRRGLVDSEYNDRRKECEEATNIARSFLSDKKIINLRDVSINDIETLKPEFSERVFRRFKHVVTENNRVLQMICSLEEGNATKSGELLLQSHFSLRDDFEVSCSELDNIVDILANTKGVAGARLTGAGFGGCVIALVNNDSITHVENNISEKYFSENLSPDTKASIWPVKISDGARIICV